MKIGLFLGAGASVPFGMPTTAQIREKLQNYDFKNLEEEVLHTFLTESKYPDIEYVLQAVKEITKFATGTGGNYFFTHGKNGIFRYKHGTVPFESFVDKIKKTEKSLENAIYENYSWKHDVDENLLRIYDKIFEVLTNHSDSISIFTTNYDRVIEEYCGNRDKYQCVDGFERKPLYSEFSRWTGSYDISIDQKTIGVNLYKLHGSLNWKEHVKHGIVKTNEESISTDPKFKRNLVILPTLSPKAEEDNIPFNEIITNFKEYMQNADGCIVIGFSFRDQQINKIFRKFINDGKALVVLSPNSMENVCINLLKVKVPEGHDKGKVSSKAPTDGNVWCIPHELSEKNVQYDMELALTHIGNK